MRNSQALILTNSFNKSATFLSPRTLPSHQPRLFFFGNCLDHKQLVMNPWPMGHVSCELTLCMPLSQHFVELVNVMLYYHNKIIPPVESYKNVVSCSRVVDAFNIISESFQKDVLLIRKSFLSLSKLFKRIRVKHNFMLSFFKPQLQSMSRSLFHSFRLSLENNCFHGKGFIRSPA